eukprot:3168987-Alexandrium_andersonii.AAC.1
MIFGHHGLRTLVTVFATPSRAHHGSITPRSILQHRQSPELQTPYTGSEVLGVVAATKTCLAPVMGRDGVVMGLREPL